MNKLDLDYQNLLKDILENGVEKQDRTGTGTISVFGRQIRHKMSEGFPLLTTKKMYFKGIVTELLWFLRGDTNIKYLLNNDCNIWTGDAYKNYCKFFEENFPDENPCGIDVFVKLIKNNDDFAKTWGELGPVYGKQWRNWHTKWDIVEDKSKEAGVRRIENGIDQIANLIRKLKTNPDSRRLMVSAWNVGELDQMTLPPCHYGFQVYTRELSFEERHMLWHDENKKANVSPYMEKQLTSMLDEKNVPNRAISLMFNMRSNDVPLGLPFNIASYALLLEIIAKEVNMVPDELIGNLGDCHIYKNQIDGVKEQLTRESYQLPKLKLDDWYSTQGDVNNSTEVIMDCLMGLNHGHINLENYQSHPTIKIPLSN